MTDVVIVSYHRPSYLAATLRSVRNAGAPCRLTVIDHSCGANDAVIAAAVPDRLIRQENLGKAAGFMANWPTVAASDPFVVLDGDLVLPGGWLAQLHGAAAETAPYGPLGLLAPLLAVDANVNVPATIASQRLHMHRWGPETEEIAVGVWRCRHVAGPIMLIGRRAFEQAGGYQPRQRYGADDGDLCRACWDQGAFVGFTTRTVAIHLGARDDQGYRDWKRRNVNGDTDSRGYWDPQ